MAESGSMDEPRIDIREQFDDLRHRLLIGQVSSFFRKFYRENGRAFPWRERGVPAFGILIAEMLLRQTRAEQVAAAWLILMERYPSPADLAAADLADLYTLLAPLGLGRQRAEALTAASAALVTRHRGKVPRSIDVLAAIPHLGLYSAHAIACFAYGQRVPVVDTNVLRVLSRLFGEPYSPDNRRAQAAWDRAASLLPLKASIREHNYGLLDFAAMICKPGLPHCRVCRLNELCSWCCENVWDKRERLPDGSLGLPIWPN
jgi:A/G-specific adenine glycosylase